VKTLLRFLDENGFAIVREAIPRELIDELFNALPLDFAGVRQPHRTMPAVNNFVRSSPMRELAQAAIGKEPQVVRSILFDKNPARNWSVPWHQDLTIAVRQRLDVPGFTGWSVKEGIPHAQAPAKVLEQMLTVRIHLDDCDEHNGALSVLPGSHKLGLLDSAAIDRCKASIPATPCAIPRGGILLMRPLLLHSSTRAKNPSHRRVLHLEYSSARLPFGLEWAETSGD
jgi:ectoine hydroxylase-related dioxygenase (phytanoyl-CoA dioxygenase family)